MNDITVSVIMAVYNGEAFIKEAIDSILQQTFQNFELIITNDNSTDNTLNIIEEYNDERIKVINNDKNLGPAGARNKAIRAVCGEYIAIFDSDDVALPEKLDTQVRFLNEYKDIMFIGSYVYEIDENGKEISIAKAPVKSDQIRSSILFRSPFVHSASMFRRTFMEKNNLFYKEDYFYSEDYELFSRAVFAGKSYNIPKPLIKYRWSANQISTKRKDEQLQITESIFADLIMKLGIHPTDDILITHTLFLSLKEFSSSEKSVSDILGWVVELYRKNYETKIFENTSFGNEILLRFLRFSVVNKIGVLNIIKYQLKLHLKMKKWFFPYFIGISRRAKKY